MGYRFDNLRLEKGMYNEAGRSFTQVLEREDPSEQYKGTALEGLERIFLPGFAYAKAGVMLYGLERADAVQGSLLALAAGIESGGDGRRQSLMRSLDNINNRFGRDTVIFGAQGMGEAPWHMRQEHRSPRLTTCWNELPLARC